MKCKESKWISRFRIRVILTLAVIVILPVLVYVLVFCTNQFTLEIRLTEGTQISVNAGDEFLDPGVELFFTGSFLARKGIPLDGQIEVTGEVNMDVPGTYTVYYKAHWHKLEAEAVRLVVVRDATPPRITLYSVPGQYTIPGEQYQEEGYAAWDNCDGDLTPSVTRLKSEDYVTYIVTDSAGNRTSVSRKIFYYDPVPPEITLLGDSTLYISAGTGYSEPGWHVQDNADGDISDRVQVSGTVDKYRAGSYELTYTAADLTGNQAQAVRTVVVKAKGVPKTITPENRVIYLTFDDGPGPYTRELLEILEKYDAKATFFVVDSEYSQVLKEIVAGGHAIGIHSVTHDYRSIYASPEAYFNDLLTMQEKIYDATGVKTWLMRFPGGSSNTVSSFTEGIMTYLTQAVQDNGFQYFDWNVDSNDAGGAKNAQQVYDNVVSAVEKRRISIVLQHDIKSFSVEAVEKILIWGLENGYQFRALDMTSPTAHHGVNN